jgi:mannitol-1-phosphate 5-dehydrogenase
MQRDGLVPFVDGADYAVLVEEFNRILVSRVLLPDFQRGIEVFIEKPDLLPFEEAKLYGHNAAHALLGYLADRVGLTFVGETDSVLRGFAEQAFLEESGGALCERHRGVDSLFTQAGWAEYVHDLIQRMVNPFLRDRVDRVIRDPRRKLGWNDRFIGTMRLALAHEIEPANFALGAAAAVDLLLRHEACESVSALYATLWNEEESRGYHDAILSRVERARSSLLKESTQLSCK